MGGRWAGCALPWSSRQFRRPRPPKSSNNCLAGVAPCIWTGLRLFHSPDLGYTILSSNKTVISHLRRLEAESIHILREVAAEFSNPVMLYSIGKDSSVMLRLAQKAFYPSKPPFPLLHVDTSFKFREMITFRDSIASNLGLRLIVHSSMEDATGVTNPFRLGTQRCCAVLKTGALLNALQKGGFDAAVGGARRDEEKSRAK